jgi:hypothetical protein
VIRPPLQLAATVLLAGALVLAGCSGSGSSSPAASSDPAGSGATTTTGDGSTPTASKAVVQGVRLTADGSSLKVGDTARVSWEPDQKKTGVIAVKVTKLQQVPIKAFADWRLTGPVLKSTPYYVHASVKNLGSSNLSGVPVPLYLLDQDNTLLEASTFRARYDACPSRPFPSSFKQGKRTSVCLVYFAPHHGKLDAVSFRPTQDVAGITWRGPVAVVKTTKKKNSNH